MSSTNINQIRILIIDDDEDDFFITSDLLKQIQGYQLQIDWCYKYSDAVEQLKDPHYDIYFVDYRLGAKTGLDFLKEALNMGVQEPIVLLTGKGNREIDIEAMQMGATDYLIKTELTDGFRPVFSCFSNFLFCSSRTSSASSHIVYCFVANSKE